MCLDAREWGAPPLRMSQARLGDPAASIAPPARRGRCSRPFRRVGAAGPRQPHRRGRARPLQVVRRRQASAGGSVERRAPSEGRGGAPSRTSHLSR